MYQFDKPELEFVDPTKDGRFAWTPVEGDKTGKLQEIILAGAHERGWVTRMLRFPPGTDTTINGTFTHDVWEEVWICDGSFTDTRLGETFTKGMYACRPPGMQHGPWISEEGCVTFEIRYPEPSGSLASLRSPDLQGRPAAGSPSVDRHGKAGSVDE